MPFRDSMFLLAESRERPTHVGSLMLFDRPEGAGPDFLAEFHRRLLAGSEVAPEFRRRAERSVASLGQWSWVDDDNLDIEYHVRLSALPRPGRIRELLELVSRLHGSLLDRHRPLWEFHLIDGVEGERFAVYAKIHHAMMDGVRSMRHLQKALSTDPARTDMAAFWAVESRSPRPGNRSAAPPEADDAGPSPAGFLSGTWGAVTSLAAGGWHAATSLTRTTGEALGVAPALFSTAMQGLGDPAMALPFQAPPSMLNVPITGARRFAAQSWPLKRIRRVRERTGATINDVVLTMSAGALRRYLVEHDALPDKPLIAALPVALKSDDPGASGNQLGAILVNLGTDDPDPESRFARIRESGQQAKRNLADRNGLSTAALSMAVAAPMSLGALPGASSLVPPGFNLIISNVPGPTATLYWEGARLDGLYPVSVPYDGQALNITVTTYGDNMEVGLTGCRRSVPRLQRMLGYLEESLVELEALADATDEAAGGAVDDGGAEISRA